MTVSIGLGIAKIYIVIEFKTKVIQIKTWCIILFKYKITSVIQSLTHLKNLIFISSQCFPKSINHIGNFSEILTLCIIDR